MRLITGSAPSNCVSRGISPWQANYNTYLLYNYAFQIKLIKIDCKGCTARYIGAESNKNRKPNWRVLQESNNMVYEQTQTSVCRRNRRPTISIAACRLSPHVKVFINSIVGNISTLWYAFIPYFTATIFAVCSLSHPWMARQYYFSVQNHNTPVL